jgi:hypothetical protein
VDDEGPWWIRDVEGYEFMTEDDLAFFRAQTLLVQEGRHLTTAWNDTPPPWIKMEKLRGW